MSSESYSSSFCLLIFLPFCLFVLVDPTYLLYGIFDIQCPSHRTIPYTSFFLATATANFTKLAKRICYQIFKTKGRGLRALLEKLQNWYRLVASQSCYTKLRSEYLWPAPLPCGQHTANFHFATCQASRQFDIFVVKRTQQSFKTQSLGSFVPLTMFCINSTQIP